MIDTGAFEDSFAKINFSPDFTVRQLEIVRYLCLRFTMEGARAGSKEMLNSLYKFKTILEPPQTFVLPEDSK